MAWKVLYSMTNQFSWQMYEENIPVDSGIYDNVTTVTQNSHTLDQLLQQVFDTSAPLRILSNPLPNGSAIAIACACAIDQCLRFDAIHVRKGQQKSSSSVQVLIPSRENGALINFLLCASSVEVFVSIE